MSKRSYHHGELRNALLDAAEALVRDHGVGGWSLREASAQVGVSPSAAYHHFASRDALMSALAERVLARLGARMAGAVAEAGRSGDPYGGVVAAGRAYVRWVMKDPWVARLTFESGGVPNPDAKIEPHPHDVIDAELDRLVVVGALKASARPGADFALWAAIHGLATLLADGLMIVGSASAADLQTERLVRAVVAGLADETTPPGGWPAARSAHTVRRRRS